MLSYPYRYKIDKCIPDGRAGDGRICYLTSAPIHGHARDPRGGGRTQVRGERGSDSQIDVQLRHVGALSRQPLRPRGRRLPQGQERGRHPGFSRRVRRPEGGHAGLLPRGRDQRCRHEGRQQLHPHPHAREGVRGALQGVYREDRRGLRKGGHRAPPGGAELLRCARDHPRRREMSDPEPLPRHPYGALRVLRRDAYRAQKAGACGQEGEGTDVLILRGSPGCDRLPQGEAPQHDGHVQKDDGPRHPHEVRVQHDNGDLRGCGQVSEERETVEEGQVRTI